MDKFTESLASLLPTGFAWPRDPDSVLMRTISGVAGGFAELDEFIRATVAQWQPHTAVTRLAEWEEACGLPDACFGAGQSEVLRRKLLLLRLRPVDLPYDDSCPAGPGVIASFCTAIGYPGVTVSYNTPFRVGRNRVGDRMGALNGVLNVRVPAGSTPFRVGRGRVGDRLVSRVGVGPELACYLDRVVPARFQINVIYE
jgi:uncharacterized protein YmfQ (DUF2313 family)